MNNIYKNYFKNHYDYSFSKEDIERYQKFFFKQWKFINKKIKIQGPVLEIGSACGGFFFFLNKFNAINRYVGLELDPAAVLFCKEFFKSNNFLNCSLLDFNSSSKFDYVCAFEVLEHFDDPIYSIKKINILLKKNGVFIGTTPYPFKKNIYADKTHNFVLHPDNWKRLFLNNGFKKVELYPMSFFPVLWRINKKLNLKIPFYVSFPFFISTTLIIAHK